MDIEKVIDQVENKLEDIVEASTMVDSSADLINECITTVNLLLRLEELRAIKDRQELANKELNALEISSFSNAQLYEWLQSPHQ